MTDMQIFLKLNSLKPSLKSEVYDFVDFLFKKQEKEISVNIPQFGCGKGRFKLSDDFDTPLDELKEYMY